jgi:hypothetical protein
MNTEPYYASSLSAFSREEYMAQHWVNKTEPIRWALDAGVEFTDADLYNFGTRANYTMYRMSSRADLTRLIRIQGNRGGFACDLFMLRLSGYLAYIMGRTDKLEQRKEVYVVDGSVQYDRPVADERRHETNRRLLLWDDEIWGKYRLHNPRESYVYYASDHIGLLRRWLAQEDSPHARKQIEYYFGYQK